MEGTFHDQGPHRQQHPPGDARSRSSRTASSPRSSSSARRTAASSATSTRARVTRVLPGMQSAFVDIGLERDAFLYVADVFEELPENLLDPRGAAAAAAQSRNAPIEERLREGQDVLVQVLKEPLGTKGARITSHVSLPGRYLVFMPTVEHVGVSRKITDDEERRRLKTILKEIRQERGGGGFIARTAGQGREPRGLRARRRATWPGPGTRCGRAAARERRARPPPPRALARAAAAARPPVRRHRARSASTTSRSSSAPSTS